jgi:hypothetical protein
MCMGTFILEHLKSAFYPNRRRLGIGTVKPSRDYRAVDWARNKQVQTDGDWEHGIMMHVLRVCVVNKLERSFCVYWNRMLMVDRELIITEVTVT